MENAKVFDLIRKFEQLSNQISTTTTTTASNPVLTRQRSVGGSRGGLNVAVEGEPPKTPKIGSDGHVVLSWTHNPITAIEGQISSLKTTIGQLSHVGKNDEKLIMELVICLADLLIKLSDVDTDGVRPMKLKKESCLRDLKSIKDELIQLVGVDQTANNGSEKEVVKADEAELLEVGESAKCEPREDCIATTQENGNVENNEGWNGKLSCVRDMTRIFENGEESPGVTKNAPTMEKRQVSFEQDNDAVEDVPQPNPVPINSSSYDDLASEVAYLAEAVDGMDPENLIEFETLEESLLEMQLRLEDHPDLKAAVDDMLQRLLATKDAEPGRKLEIPTIQVTNSNNSSSASIVDAQQACNDFIEAEQGNVAMEPPSTTKAAPTMGGPETSSRSDTVDRLNFYKNLMAIYLEKHTEVIIQHEGDIQEHYNDIRQFVPHADLQQEFDKLIAGYKDVLDLITETKFSLAYQAAMDGDEDERNERIFNAMNDMDRLNAEIEKYYGILEALDPKDLFKAQVLRENLADVQAEVEESDASEVSKEAALGRIKELRDILESKCS